MTTPLSWMGEVFSVAMSSTSDLFGSGASKIWLARRRFLFVTSQVLSEEKRIHH